jgi:hypothetical protein
MIGELNWDMKGGKERRKIARKMTSRENKLKLIKY